MDTNQAATEQSPFVKAGWFLGRSRAGRLLLSIGITALFCGAAYMAWQDRELAALVLAAWLLAYGLQLAWNLLPISEATRSRWRHDRQTAERSPANKYRLMLWTGIAIGITEWLWPVASHDYFVYIVAGVLVAVGVVSHFLCYRFVRHERRM